MFSSLQGVQRALYSVPSLVLGQEMGISVERWLRGWEEVRELRKCDVAVVSFGNSGRTWLRVMLSQAFVAQHGIASSLIIDRDNLKRLCPLIPSVFFTHDNYIRDYTGSGGSKDAFKHVPVIFLARHPADIAVSQYHQWKQRMRYRKKAINGYPLVADMPLFDFVMSQTAGLPKIISYMNEWAEAVDRLPQTTILKYEDLKENTAAELHRIFDFMGRHIAPEHISMAVEHASIERMRKLESSGEPLIASGKTNKDRSTQDSFKARRGKAKGYTQDFSAQELNEIEGVIRTTLNPRLPYAIV